MRDCSWVCLVLEYYSAAYLSGSDPQTEALRRGSTPGSKRAAFSGQKPPIKAYNTAKNPPLVGHFPFCAAPDEQAHP
jgi:hypothetical protein